MQYFSQVDFAYEFGYTNLLQYKNGFMFGNYLSYFPLRNNKGTPTPIPTIGIIHIKRHHWVHLISLRRLLAANIPTIKNNNINTTYT